MSRHTPGVTIAIPAFNEEATLADVVLEALSAGRESLDGFNLLIVDDGSTDNTGAIANTLANDNPEVMVVHHNLNLGFSGALASAVDNADQELVAIAPADGQADMSDIARLVSEATSCDLVFSYRKRRDDPTIRKAASVIWYGYMSLLFGYRIRQFSSLFVFRRDLVASLGVDVKPTGANFLPVLYFKARRNNVKIAWVGTAQPRRLAGNSKGASLVVARRTVLEGLQLWWRLRVRHTDS